MAQGFGDVALVGVGISTRATARYLMGLPSGQVRSCTAFAGSAPALDPEVAHEFEELGVRVVCGTQTVAGTFDMGVISPGIPVTSDFYASAQASCAELISEPELAWRESPARWFAITGTNGKTTTTSLAAHLFEEAGIPACPVGNIGYPPISRVADRLPDEVFVAELSSFQLQSTAAFAPRVAALLNVTPDHVEWHGSLEAYAEAKERIFAHMHSSDLCILGNDDHCTRLAQQLRLKGLRVCVVSSEEPCACLADAAWMDARGRLVVRLHGSNHVLCPFADMQLKGTHNMYNALTAAAGALECGADDEAVIRGLLTFSALDHRVQPCGGWRGIDFCDDSKATNVDAAQKALEAFEPGHVVLLAGGHDKGTDLTDLARAAVKACRVIVAFGEASERLASAFEAARTEQGADCQIIRAAGMRAAFEEACNVAIPADTVLLSPACSSFDEFSGYAERGSVFQGWVRQLIDTDGVSEDRV